MSCIILYKILKHLYNLKSINMKKTIISAIFLLAAKLMFSQSIENKCLVYNEIESNVTTSNTNNNLIITPIKIVGNKKSQTVEIEFLLKHNLVNQILEIHTQSGAPFAYDLEGNGYKFENIYLPNIQTGFGTKKVELPTDINVKGKVTFNNVHPQTDYFALVKMDYYLHNISNLDNRETFKFETKNLKINWL